MEKVCAVVVTYNRKDILRECLKYLNSQTRKLDEIIVVDNASTDGTERIILEEFPEVKYIKLEENLGGSMGFHIGLKTAYKKGFDWFWTMDDDVGAIYKDTLQKMLSFVEKEEKDKLGAVLPTVGMNLPTAIFAGGLIYKKTIEKGRTTYTRFLYLWR